MRRQLHRARTLSSEPPLQVGTAHAAALAAIHASAFPPHDAWSETAIASLLTSAGVSAWIDPAGGMVIARLAADEAEILTLGVAPAARRRGVGRRLLATTAAAMAGQGARSLFLEVSDLNSAAAALYFVAGFTQVGERRRYYADGSNALLLKLSLVE